MKKYLAIFLVLTMFVALLPTAAFADGIRLFNGKIEIAEPLEHAAKVYEEATGKHVEVESLGGGVDLQATLKQYYQAGNMPEIFVGEGKTDFDNWTGMMVDMTDWEWAALSSAFPTPPRPSALLTTRASSTRPALIPPASPGPSP